MKSEPTTDQTSMGNQGGAQDQANKQVLDTTGIKPPKKDTRYKTEDVTATKGMSFADFGLCKEL